MRIVGGRLRGLKLAEVGAGDPAAHLRPTTDRVREAVFNLLLNSHGFPIEGARVLDLFAGTGALGLEALSRGAARVAFHPDTGYLLNPNYEQLKASSLDMVVAGTETAVLMVESEAQELTEDQMLGAVLFAHDEFQAVIRAVKELAAEAGKPAWMST